MNPRYSKQVTLFADYFQFYLWDAWVKPDAPGDWTDADVSNRIKVEDDVVVICPIRNMEVNIILEYFDGEPPVDLAVWDHVAECSLQIASGLLEVHECNGGSVAQVPVAPGMQQVRALYGSLGDLSDNGLEGNDHYTIQLWPGSEAEMRIVKRYVDPA